LTCSTPVQIVNSCQKRKAFIENKLRNERNKGIDKLTSRRGFVIDGRITRAAIHDKGVPM